MGVSANGLVVVGWSTDQQVRSRGFRWIAATGLVDLGALSGHQTEAFAVNGAGNEVFGQSEQAFRWRAGQMAALSTLGGPASAALGCTRDGSWVAGWALTPSMLQVACAWNDTAIIPLYSPWGRKAEARAVADGGTAVVGSAFDSIGQSHAFSWNQVDGMRFLPTWGLSASAWGVSQDGNTTVGLYFAGSMRRAFVHKPSTGTMDLTSLASRALSGTGSRLESAVAVSRDGRFVVGQGWNGALQRLDGYILDLQGKLFRGESGKAAH
jgi:probable HAF family extracellular repeat protein